MSTPDGVEITIGGVRFAGFDSGATFTYGTVDEDGEFTPRNLMTESYEVSGEMTMPREAVDRLMHALTPPRRGTSDATLARRVYYGGRKGRSALRRLYAKGYLGVYKLDGHAMPLSYAMLRSARQSFMNEAVARSRRVLEEMINREVVPEFVEKALVNELREVIITPVRLEGL